MPILPYDQTAAEWHAGENSAGGDRKDSGLHEFKIKAWRP